MTNFHVVDSAVAFTKGYWKRVNNQWQYDNVDKLIEYYSQSLITKYDISSNRNYFELSTYSDQNQSYHSLIATNKPNSSQPIITNNNIIKDVSIITDFNNDSVDLFSKSDNNKNTIYNLDMSLIKISMNFINHQELLKTEE